MRHAGAEVEAKTQLKLATMPSAGYCCSSFPGVVAVGQCFAGHNSSAEESEGRLDSGP